MDQIRTAVVGVGHMGRWHADKFAALKNSHLVALADQDGDRCRQLASEFGVDALNDYRDLIGQVDAVSIATPTASHFDIAHALLDSGIHVLIEKPMTSTVEQARELVELASGKNVVLQVGHLERFNPAIAGLTKQVDNPQFIESHRISPYKPRSLDVSVVLDLMIHDIDLIHSLVRSPMAQVEATGKEIITDNFDIANARIRFENGCVANVTSSRISFKTEHKLRIFQSNAYFSIDLFNKKATSYHKKSEGPIRSPMDIKISKSSAKKSDALLVQSEAFLASVAGGPPPVVNGRIGMEALETALAITEAIRH